MNKTTQVNKITPATPADPPPPKAAFPCQISDYRVNAATELRVFCGVPADHRLEYAVQITELDKDGKPIGTQDATFVLDPKDEAQWAKVKVNSPLKKETSYQLSLPNYPTGFFAVQTYKFDTKGRASVVVPFTPSGVFQRADGRLRFLLSSKVALDEASLKDGAVTEDLPPLHRPMDAKFVSYRDETHEAVPSSDAVGLAFIWIAPPGPKSLDTHLSVTGVKNIFGALVVVPDSQRLKLALQCDNLKRKGKPNE